jgi:hypothetical protein
MTETLTRTRMTMEEIKREFDGEWVIIDEPVTDERMDILHGTVIYHSKNRDDTDRELLALPPPINVAVLYIGEIKGGFICL